MVPNFDLLYPKQECHMGKIGKTWIYDGKKKLGNTMGNLDEQIAKY